MPSRSTGSSAFADARGVEQRHRIAAEIEMHLDHVARGAGERRHDRGLAPRDAVEQASTCRRSADPRSRPPGPRAAARRVRRRPALRRSRRAARCAISARGAIRSSGTSASSEKSMPRLDQRQCLDQPRAPGLGAVAEQAVQLPKRLPALRLGLGADQVGQALDRGEVELAVLEGAAGELARLRQAAGPRAGPSAASTAAITARPPCSCNSAMSSPVSLRGPGNQSASASSMASPVAGSRTRASAA